MRATPLPTSSPKCRRSVSALSGLRPYSPRVQRLLILLTSSCSPSARESGEGPGSESAPFAKCVRRETRRPSVVPKRNGAAEALVWLIG